MYYCGWLLLILHVAPWFSAGGFSVLATLTSLYRRILPAVWGYRLVYIHYIYVNNSHKSASQSPLPAIDLFRLLGPHKNHNLEFSPLKDSSKSRLSSSQKSRMHFYCHCCCCSDWCIYLYILFLLLCYALLFAFSLPHFLLANVVSCAKRGVNTKLLTGNLWQLYDYLLSDLDWEAAAIELVKREKRLLRLIVCPDWTPCIVLSKGESN